MGWRRDELWLQTDVLWFRERARVPMPSPAFAAVLSGNGAGVAIRSGLAESRQRRAARRQRERSRRARAAALVIGSTAVLPLGVHRLGSGSLPQVLPEDPPSLTIRPVARTIEPAGAPIPDSPGVQAIRPRSRARRLAAAEQPQIDWNRATSRGLPYAGSLDGGTRLPLRGPDWVTWHPVEDTVPNAPGRLYAHERTIHRVVSVVSAYRVANPRAARVVVGDLSFREGGPMDQHVSHQNGLDVDVYYPRRDGAERAPATTDQLDRALAQDLLDRFVAAGAEKVFVGYSTGLHGPHDVVVPYPNHEDHMHVRFPSPDG